MGGNDFTLMLVPHSNARARRITISKRVIYSFSATILIFILSFAFLAYRNFTSVLDQVKYEQLAKENQILLEEFHQTQSDIDNLKQTLSRLVAQDQQLRIVADLPSVDPEARLMGVGGPDYGEDSPIQAVREAYGIDGMRADLDALVLQAEYQNTSFDEILGKMQKDRKVWSHTPSILPVNDPVLTSKFGMRRNPLTGKLQPHKGVDFSAPSGTPVYATANGTVDFAGRKNGFGLVVILDHGYGYKTVYAHNSVNLVSEGEEIQRGDMIARVGNTGRSTGSHLHYEVRVNNTHDNPLKYIITESLEAF